MAKMSTHALWQVVKHEKTGEIVCINVADDNTLYKKVHSENSYAVIAAMPSRADAENYAQLLSANISIDAVMYLRLQRNLLSKVLSGDVPDEAQLKELVSDARRETGRTCLGNCKSECNQTACRICYNSRFSTWQLCANLQAMKQLQKLLENPAAIDEVST